MTQSISRLVQDLVSLLFWRRKVTLAVTPKARKLKLELYQRVSKVAASIDGSNNAATSGLKVNG